MGEVLSGCTHRRFQRLMTGIREKWMILEVYQVETQLWIGHQKLELGKFWKSRSELDFFSFSFLSHFLSFPFSFSFPFFFFSYHFLKRNDIRPVTSMGREARCQWLNLRNGMEIWGSPSRDREFKSRKVLCYSCSFLQDLKPVIWKADPWVGYILWNLFPLHSLSVFIGVRDFQPIWTMLRTKVQMNSSLSLSVSFYETSVCLAGVGQWENPTG